MKKSIHRIYLFVAIALLAITGIAAPAAHAAPSGLYLSPSSGSYTTGSSFTTEVRMNTGSNSGVQSNLTFDPARLEVTNYSTQGSALSSVTVTYNNQAGTITIYSGSSSNDGDRLITTLTFRTLSAGDTSVSFTGTNQTLSYLLVIPIWNNITTNTASYTITNPPVVTPSTPNNPTPVTTPTSPNTSTPGGTSSNTVNNPSATSPSNSSPTSDSNTTTPQNSTDTATPEKTPPTTSTTPGKDRKEKAMSKTQRNTTTQTTKKETLNYWLLILATITTGLLVILLAGLLLAYNRFRVSKSLQRLLNTVTIYSASPAHSVRPRKISKA